MGKGDMQMVQGRTTGVLLVNTGTPDQPTVPAVRRYLQQFLMDERILNLPYWQRWPLVNLLIAPFRAPKSATAYQRIWGQDGSPLLVHGQALAAGLQERLGPEYRVVLGMAVGNPSIEAALALLKGCNSIRVVPLFPQYAGATWGGVLEAVYRLAGQQKNVPPLRVIEPFYQHPAWVSAVVSVSRPFLVQFQPDTVLFSFHGLPEQQVMEAGMEATHPCLKQSDCCLKPHRYCYRAHCLASAEAISRQLALSCSSKVVFQSRLGRARWLEPSLEQSLKEAGASGSKRLAVLTPSFVADCLETLEEIGIHGKETFKAAGGEELLLVPSLNSQASWVEGLAQLILG
jgi:ferrochelatase